MSSNNQMIDLQSQVNENLTQTLQINEMATYLLSFQWLPPYSNLTGKSAFIFMNDAVIDTIFINSSNCLITVINNYFI